MLRRLFTRQREAQPAGEPLTYAEQRRQVQDTEPGVRASLAGRSDTRPEILYFLADDSDPVVRQAVAANHAAPVQADVILSKDGDDDVRLNLADKIGRLVPDMPEEEREKVRELTEQVLETLARDELIKVRATLAEHLKHTSKAPATVIRRLAEDIEAAVAAPVLECSPMLSDHDLLEIIRISRADGAVSAIARRNGVSAPVADSIVAGEDRAAVAALLANDSAQIREETLDKIIAEAVNVEPWHAPLVARPGLSGDAVRKLSRFVAGALVRKLAERNDLDDTIASELAALVERNGSGRDKTTAPAGGKSAEELHRQGQLNEETVSHAISLRDESFVFEALALMSDIDRGRVEKMIRVRNAKVVTSLAWKAGLSMRTAMELQKTTARIAPPEILNARFGTEFPLTSKEMAETLSVY
jgi:uncharacterized protein (DUF2336 family)